MHPPPFDRSIDHSNPLARNIDVHTGCVHRLCLNCGETKLENLAASTCHLSVVKMEERARKRDEIESINSLPECPCFIHLFNCRSNHVLIQSSNLLVVPPNFLSACSAYILPYQGVSNVQVYHRSTFRTFLFFFLDTFRFDDQKSFFLLRNNKTLFTLYLLLDHRRLG